MATTNFVSGTVVESSWLNDVDDGIYRKLAETVSVKDFGATGDGTTDDTVAIQAAIDAVTAAGGGEVTLPPGRYLAPSVVLKSNVTLIGYGATIVDSFWTATGSVGAEIPLTSAATRGATSLSLVTTGIAADDWLRISSVVNSNSPDAGVYQCGEREQDNSYLAEYVRANVITSGSALSLHSALLFPYSNTPGTDTDAGLTNQTSVVRRMAFLENVTLRGLSFEGRYSTSESLLQLKWCRSVNIDDCTFDVDGGECGAVTVYYCLDCHVRGGRMIGYRTGPSSFVSNVLVIRSSQYCDVVGVTFEGGYQSFDVTYQPNDTTYRAGPSIICGARDCVAMSPLLDGFTDHPGVWMSFFENCTSTGGSYGFRIRGRGSRVTGCKGHGDQGSGAGIYIADAAVVDGIVTNSSIDGFSFGIYYAATNADYDALFSTVGGGCLIAHNIVRNQTVDGIVAGAAYTSATLKNVAILNNTVHLAGDDGINVLAYNNGAVVSGNRVFGVGSGLNGIEYGANIKRLYIGDNWVYGVDGAGFALKGAGTSSMMTDATTFPSGEAEAELFIGQIHTDAAVPFTSVIRNAAAFVTTQPAGWQPFFASIGNAAPAASERSTFAQWIDAAGGLSQRWKNSAGTNYTVSRYTGSGSPEGAVTAAVGSLYTNTAGGAGTTLYIKESGAGNTGWVAK